MKRKVIYLVALICCMSFFSSAKQNGKNCEKKHCCLLQKQNAAKQSGVTIPGSTGFDLSPLQLFVFSI
jgi:hypothetical protein